VRAAVTGAGIVSLQIRGHDGRTLTALAERGALAGGEVVTLRLADATIVWFVQLGVRSVQGSEVGRDLVELGLGGLLAVPSERWAERAAYDGRLEVRSGGAAVAGRVRDISPLGIGFTLPEPALEGDALELSVELPDGARVPLRARPARRGRERRRLARGGRDRRPGAQRLGAPRAGSGRAGARLIASSQGS
jgi:hypothetical protein